MEEADAKRRRMYTADLSHVVVDSTQPRFGGGISLDSTVALGELTAEPAWAAAESGPANATSTRGGSSNVLQQPQPADPAVEMRKLTLSGPESRGDESEIEFIKPKRVRLKCKTPEVETH